MFWDKNYTPSQNIEALLKKENVTVEEFLDEDDIIQECKSQKKALLNYFMRPDVIRRLVELTLTEPPEELPVAQRFRHANVACELLTLGLPSLDEKLLADADTLKLLYSYLENQPPLNPLLASFFSKTFRTLFTKKSDQDWFLYQQMCLKLLEYLKLQNNFLDLICKHFTTPVIPDLIMQMMRNVEGGQLKRSLYDWLNAEGLIEKLIRILAESEECEKHANVSEFLCDLIQQGRTMRQTEQDNDSFEPAFDGSNPILKNIESAPTLEALFNVILQPNAQESAIVSGITVVLKIIKPIVIVDERNSDRLKFLQDRERKIHEDLLKTVICVIEPHLKHFNELLRNPPKKPDIVISAATLSPPFGTTRLQICRLFTVLLQTNNEDISKAICETDFFETLLYLFKQYCWNNFLHSEVEKCLQIVFYNSSTNYNNNNISNNISTQIIDSSQNRRCNLGDNVFDNNRDNIFNIKEQQQCSPVVVYPEIDDDRRMGDGLNVDEDRKQEQQRQEEREAELIKEDINSEMAVQPVDEIKNEEQSSEGAKLEFVEVLMESNVNVNVEQLNANIDEMSTENVGDNNEQDLTKVSVNMGPSNLQTHVIVNCKIISKLMDCWQHNRDVESVEKGCRLGYMGHLIQIFRHVINCISECENIGALIEANFQSDAERELWHSIMNNDTGDLTKALKTQSQLLANCNAHEACDYNITLDFLADTDLSDAFSLCAYTDNSDAELINNTLNLLQFDDDDEDENATGGEVLSIYGRSSALLSPFTATSNPWEMNDDFNMLKSSSAVTAGNSAHWAADIGPDNFADFDAHFSSFSNDLGESFGVSTASNAGNECVFSNETGSNANKIGSENSEGYDNNANVEKPGWPANFLRLQIKNEAQFIANNLIDDYEDDEGMWTRPLGMPLMATDEHLRKAASQLQQLNTQTAATNGPSKEKSHDQGDEKEEVTEDDDKLNNSLEEDKRLKANPMQFYFTEGFDQDDANEINLDVKPSMHKLNTLDIENKLSNINSSVTDEETTTAAADVKDNVTTT
ncbi:phosphatase 6 regulatory subunit 1-like protein fmt isoform 2-T5 [Glossina fuscipes fuscipes]